MGDFDLHNHKLTSEKACSGAPVPHWIRRLLHGAQVGQLLRFTRHAVSEGSSKAVENYALLKASVHRGLIIGGASAGANMSAVIAHRARDDPFFTGQPVTGQFLQIPFVIHPDAYPEELGGLS